VELAAYPLWYARYYTPEAMQPWPATPGQWPNIAIWQFSGGRDVPGIPNATDDNLTPLTREQLLALGKPGANLVKVDSPFIRGFQEMMRTA
jgi:GH25 family lysozyme M1 (1,4-beta-N-acetylmuramidase)